MNTIDLVADNRPSVSNKVIEYDLNACEDNLKSIFPNLIVDDVSQIELKIRALEEELKNTESENRKIAFKKIIDDRKSYLPAFSFFFREIESVVGIVSRRRIRLFCRGDVNLPNDICELFLKEFIQSMEGTLYIDGKLVDLKNG